MLNNKSRCFQEDNEFLGVFCTRKKHSHTRYKENVESSLDFFKNEKFHKRIEYMTRAFPASLWNSEKHRRNMSELDFMLGFHNFRNTRQYYAAMYLITVNDDLIERTAYCFNRDGIDFSKAHLKGISVQNYDLLMAAKQIHTGKRYIFQNDLADPEIIDDVTFRLIINAKLIEQFGIIFLQFGNGG
jgi:hypothetical protein